MYGSSDVDMDRGLTRAHIHRVCDEDAVSTVFQPLVDLTSNETIAYEALSRFPSSDRTPRDWFAAADELGIGEKLELAAIATALAHLDAIPESAALSINVSPAVAISDAFLGIVAPLAPRLIVELTEHEPIADYAILGERVAILRAFGARVAMDDIGAGFASVADTLRLEPDIVKLDVSLTRVLATDPETCALIGDLVDRAHAGGTVVTAEGIETIAELKLVRALGIDHGQGYLFGRPTHLEAHLN